MIELNEPLIADVETEVVGFEWARQRIGHRKLDGKLMCAVSIWRRGVMLGEVVDFFDPQKGSPMIEALWPRLFDGFRLAHHNNSLETKCDDLRHG